MQQLLIILFFTLLWPSAYQAEDTITGIYEEKALDILADARDRFHSFETFYSEFEYAASATDFGSSMGEGGYLYTKGNKYRMKLNGSLFISDGITAWSFLEDINEVHISDILETEGMLTPISLIEHHRDNFHPLWIRQEVYRNKTVDVIDLVPADPHTAFSKYRVAIDKNSKLIAYIVAYDRQGGSYSYTITKNEINPDIPGSLFDFNPDDYPGIEVIDLR